VGTRRLVRIYLEDASPQDYNQFVNDLWARMPEYVDWRIVLDAQTDVDAANADYDERYRETAEWGAGQVAGSDEEAEAALDAILDRRHSSKRR
jgi:hypothetical protein